MPMTVTATQGGTTSNGLLLRVYVLTGAAAAASQTGGAVNASHASNVNAWTISITTSAGSNVYGTGSCSGSGNTPTGTAATIVDQFADSTNAETYITHKSLNVTSGATTRGFSASPATAGSQAMLEILASGTLAEDSSAPAVATTTSATTVTTASFTPVNNALLVAVVSSDGGSGVTTMTVSGGGLTWTEKSHNNASGEDYAGIWIADGPAGTTPSQVLNRAPYVPPAAPRQIPPQVITGPVPQSGTASPGIASAQATALDATVSTVGSPNAGLATGTGAALDTTVALTVNALLASGTAAALQPSVSAIGTTGQPAVRAFTLAFPVPLPIAPQVITGPVPSSPGAGLASAAAAALDSTIAITVNAGLATGTAAALQPVVSTSGSTNATAGLAGGTAAALQPVPAIAVNAGLATGTGAALPAGHGAGAILATGTGTAQAATLAIGAQAAAATALAAALGGTIPGQHVPAKSISTATDPRDGTGGVNDPRDGTATVS